MTGDLPEQPLAAKPDPSDGVRHTQDSLEAAELVEGLLLFGRLLLASGDAVSDINLKLRTIAKVWGAPEAQFIVLPNLMMASFDPDRPAHIMSRDLAAEHLRLDQVVKVMTWPARRSAAGSNRAARSGSCTRSSARSSVGRSCPKCSGR